MINDPRCLALTATTAGLGQGCGAVTALRCRLAIVRAVPEIEGAGKVGWWAKDRALGARDRSVEER